MSNIIDSIQLSGVTYTIQGSGGNPTVELTQAEYDALVTAGTVSPTTYYIITDAQAGDLTQYWTSAQTQSAITEATSGKVNTSSVVTAVTSASTNSEIPTAKAVYDAIPTGGTGGGKAISAGTNISVTTGETADTINCTLPIVMNKSNMRINSGNREFANNLSNCFNFGGFNTVGNGSSCSYLVTFGSDNDMSASGSNRKYRFAFGTYLKTQNQGEIAFSQYNNSVSASTTFGNSGNTLFSVGNGTADNARHNAFEIRQNGDIYLSLNGQDVKLQDQLGGGTVDQTIISGSTNAVAGGAVYDKFDEVEEVTAAALNNINDRLSEDEEVTAAALNDLNDTIGNINTILESI